VVRLLRPVPSLPVILDPGIKRRLQRIAATFNAKARRLHAPGVVAWQSLVLLGDTCHYCGVELRLEDGTWDHVVAFDRGGHNYVTNIVRCCTTCQRTKFTKTPEEFGQHQALRVTCALPGCMNEFQPRWAEWKAGRARYCSHRCAGAAGRLSGASSTAG
jgi:hypothetical protein